MTAAPLPPYIQIRGVVPADHPFVADSWVRSFAPFRPTEPGAALMQGRSARAPMDMEAYKAGQGAIADALMSAVLVAQDDAGNIAGWAAADSGCLHYVYVRQALRRFGVARRLLEVVGPCSEYSHWTPMAQRLVAGARFNPYRAWRPR